MPTIVVTWGRARASTAASWLRKARLSKSSPTNNRSRRLSLGPPPHPDAEEHLAPDPERMLTIVGASGNNLKGITLNLPVGLLVCVTGVSGSGKSTLINRHAVSGGGAAPLRSSTEPAPYAEIRGLEFFDKVINVDQSPSAARRAPTRRPTPACSRLSRAVRGRAFGGANAATGRDASRSTSRAVAANPVRAMASSRSRCTSCPTCTCLATCATASATTARRWSGNTGQEHPPDTGDDLEHAHEFFAPVPVIARKLQTLLDVGLGYITLARVRPRFPAASAAREAVAGTIQARYRTHALHPRRADHRPALSRHRTAA